METAEGSEGEDLILANNMQDVLSRLSIHNNLSTILSISGLSVAFITNSSQSGFLYEIVIYVSQLPILVLYQ